MEYGAIDLHRRRSQVRIVSEAGTVVSDQRVDTRAHELARVFGPRPRMRILLESGTESEWVAQALEHLGHDVIVTDPTYVAMYGTRSRRVKTDRRDVAALAEACRLGIYRAAHRVTRATQIRRHHLRTREHLIRMRTQTINAVRAIVRHAGHRVPSGSAPTFVARVQTLALAADLACVVAPLLATLAALGPLIAQADRWVRETAAADPVTQRLMTMPGVGGVVALSYQSALATPARFGGDAGRASAFLGLVPSEHSSGEGRHKGAITKAGPRMVRSLLVQAAWTLWRQRRRVPHLYGWVEQVAARRGRRIAVIALARRMSRILYAIWRDETVFRTAAAVA